jgi:hypothetical protein
MNKFGRYAALAAAAAAGLTLTMTSSHADSTPQLLLDKVVQLQASLNAFAADTSSKFASVLNKLDQVLQAVSPASATSAVVATGPMAFPTARFIVCAAHNVSNADITVSGRAVDLFTGPTFCTVGPVTLAPGRGNGGGCEVTRAPTFVACRLTIQGGSAAAVRASLCTSDINNVPDACLPAQ